MPPHAPCPADPEEVAEAFAFGRLTDKAATEFREHVRTCRACEQRLSDARAFIAAIKAAHEQDDLQ